MSNKFAVIALTEEAIAKLEASYAAIQKRYEETLAAMERAEKQTPSYAFQRVRRSLQNVHIELLRLLGLSTK